MQDFARVLVTGGTGSLGQAVVRYILDNCNPQAVVVFSRGEEKQVQMEREFQDERLRFFIGDVRDKDRLARAFTGVNYVIHTAAIKHVHVAKYNPEECVKTNIVGSMNVIDAALEADVKRVVAVSTDKACNPSNIYGASKLCADKLFLAANVYAPKFSVVQFGNIAGSSGSVIPLWKEQRKTGIINITHPKATRYWITPTDAAKFICRIIDSNISDEVLYPRMISATLSDLAKVVAPNCNHNITNLKPGEKLHEELEVPDCCTGGSSADNVVHSDVLREYLKDYI